MRAIATTTLRCIAAALACVALRAQADLSAEVVDLHRQATALQQMQYPGVQIYVGAAADKLLLRRVQLQIDEQAPVEYEYSSLESTALQRGGLHRLYVATLEPGTHRLRALLVARHVDAGPLTPRIELRIDDSFEFGAAPLALELGIVKPGWRDAVAPELVRGAPQPDQRERAARYAEAAQLGWRAAFEDVGGDAVLPPAGPGAAMSIEQYNGAVAMIRDGRRDAGIAALRALADGDAVGAGARRVRDLAYLTLGYQLLRDRQRDQAAEALRRVRSPGPYGNAALLALGWTSLLPSAGAGEDVAAGTWWPQDVADSPELRRRMPFRYNWSVAAGERARDLHAALVPWNELTGRDPLDPVVQEGMLVVAYALQHLGAHAQAQRHYLRSIERLQNANTSLDNAMIELRDGRMLARIDEATGDGWRRWLADLPYDETTAYFRTLVDDADVVDALEARQPLRFQQRLLAQHTQMLEALADTPQAQILRERIAALRPRVDAALRDADAALSIAAASALQARAKTTRAYLAEARFAIARMHDPSPRAREQVPQRIAAGATP